MVAMVHIVQVDSCVRERVLRKSFLNEQTTIIIILQYSLHMKLTSNNALAPSAENDMPQKCALVSNVFRALVVFKRPRNF